MNRIATLTKSFVRDEEGIAVTEYALLLALVAVGVVVVVKAFGSQLSTMFNDATTALQ